LSSTNQVKRTAPPRPLEIDELSKESIANTTIFCANQMLRIIALCYKDVDTWAPRGHTGTLSPNLPTT
jgi:Ca2+-transporting ATPase